MKRIIRLTESDLTRIVKRVISEQDEEWGQTDRGDEKLQDLIEEARDILENDLGMSIDAINEMDEWYILDVLHEHMYDELAYEIEHLLEKEGFDDLDDMPSYKTKWSMPKDSEEELGEGWDDIDMKSRYRDYNRKEYRDIPKNPLRTGMSLDHEGTKIKGKSDDDNFDEWGMDDDDEEYA